MSRLGWLGLPFLGSQDEDETGLVLSGGGARASFQLGALRYLYRETDIDPTVFVGTSAGAILASMLAQFPTRDEQADGVDILEQLWRELTAQSDMFIERTWFSKLRSHGTELLTALTAEPKPSTIRSVTISLPWLSRKEPDAPELPPAPAADPLAAALAPESPGKDEWTPGLLVQLFNNLGRLSRVGGDLPQIWQGADRTRSAYRPGPLLARLLEPDVFSPARVGSSGMKLRIAMVGLVRGELRFMREDGVLVDRDDTPIGDKQWDLALGVLASCAIPAVFAPVPIGDELYVDGGVRENLPAEMAIGHLRTNPTYIIASAPAGVDPDPTAPEADVVSIMMRAMSILTDESLRDEVAYARSAGAIMIEPELNVHDALTVDPELIAINIDYGWVRAAEAVKGVTTAEEALHRRVFELRLELLGLRRRSSLSGGKDDAVAVVHAQYALREAIAACRAGFLPEDAHLWPEAPESASAR